MHDQGLQQDLRVWVDQRLHARMAEHRRKAERRAKLRAAMAQRRSIGLQARHTAKLKRGAGE